MLSKNTKKGLELARDMSRSACQHVLQHASLSFQGNFLLVALHPDSPAVSNPDAAVELCIALRQWPLHRWRHPQPQQMPLPVLLLCNAVQETYAHHVIMQSKVPVFERAFVA